MRDIFDPENRNGMAFDPLETSALWTECRPPQCSMDMPEHDLNPRMPDLTWNDGLAASLRGVAIWKRLAFISLKSRA